MLPPHAADAIDWEGELAVVVGRTVRNATDADASSAIGGYAGYNANLLKTGGVQIDEIEALRWDPTGRDDTLRQHARSLTHDTQGRSANDPAFDPARVSSYQSGTSIRDLAKTTKLSREHIRVTIVQAGSPVRPAHRPPRQLDDNWLRDQYVLQHRTLRQIATDVGCGPSTISRHLRALNIPLRARGTPPQTNGV